MISNDFNPWKNFDNYHEQMFDDKSSDLVQWPVKLWKVPIVSPYFHHAHLLIAADCSAFSCPTFHDRLSKGKVPLICCPDSDFDISTKLENIFAHNEIDSVTIVRYINQKTLRNVFDLLCCGYGGSIARFALHRIGLHLRQMIDKNDQQ